MPQKPRKWKILFVWLVLSALGVFVMILPNIRKPRPVVYVWPKNLTRHVPDIILPQKNTTVIFPSVLSRDRLKEDAVLQMLVVVFSAVHNQNQRDVIRQTWASPHLTPDGVRIVFLLGMTTNQTFQDDVVRESSEFGDIAQEQFVDDYSNLTIKSLMMLKLYNNKCCDNVPYLFKTDDDMYVNLKRLKELADENEKADFLIGNLICDAAVIRDSSNKWYSPTYMFAARIYPNYLSGTGYLMSKSVASKLYSTSLSTPVFHMEDIYITGILAKKCGVRPADDLKFTYLKRRMSPCLHSQTITSHHLSPKEMRNVAWALSQKLLQCKKLSNRQLRNYPLSKCKWTR